MPFKTTEEDGEKVQEVTAGLPDEISEDEDVAVVALLSELDGIFTKN